MNLRFQEINELEDRKLSLPSASFGLSLCFVRDMSPIFKELTADLGSPWLSGTCQYKTKHIWKCVILTAPLSTHHHSLIHSMNIYLLPTGTGSWCIEYLEVTGLIFIHLSINIYIHSISVTIYSWLILKLCVSLSLTPAYEQIRASKISAQGLYINLQNWL